MKKEKNNLDLVVDSLIKNEDMKTYNDVSDFLDTIQERLVQVLLDGEMDNHLGYEKGDHNSKDDNNRRNGYGKNKIVKTKKGKINIKLPRDRDSSFEPIIVTKRQSIIDNFESVSIKLYSKGMSLRDIEDTIEEVYKIKLNKDEISNLISRVSSDVIKWQNRSLKKMYPFVYVDCLYIPIKKDMVSVKSAVYVIIGIDIEGKKEVIGMWIGDNEAASFWCNIFEEIKQRGVEDILFLSMDGLSGLNEAVESVFPNTITQRCIVHLVRNLYKLCPKKEAKVIISDFKKIYTSPNKEIAILEYNNFCKKYESKKAIIKKADEYMIYIKQLMEYPSEIRKKIYTTNTIESVNSALRKVTKGKGSFPNEEAVMKILYLRIRDLEKKWVKGTAGWNIVRIQLVSLFKDRITKYLDI